MEKDDEMSGKDDKMSGRVLLHWRADGSFGWIVSEGVTIICVDDTSDCDRVYQRQSDLDNADFDKMADQIIGTSEETLQ